MILITGDSDLAREIKNQCSGNVHIVGRALYDLSIKKDCDRLISDYTPQVVINTAALNQSNDVWNILTVNYVSATYLTLGFYNKLDSGHIINISSTSTYWTSWPGISDGRFFYNLSKEALSQFGKNFNRKIVDTVDKSVTVSTIELGAFKSKFNNYKESMSIEKVANLVIQCIQNPVTTIACIK